MRTVAFGDREATAAGRDGRGLEEVEEGVGEDAAAGGGRYDRSRDDRARSFAFLRPLLVELDVLFDDGARFFQIHGHVAIIHLFTFRTPVACFPHPAVQSVAQGV